MHPRSDLTGRQCCPASTQRLNVHELYLRVAAFRIEAGTRSDAVPTMPAVCARLATETIAVRHGAVLFATVQKIRNGLLPSFLWGITLEISMPFRKADGSTIWHWCRNCSDWPPDDFKQRADKPPAWNGESLCGECAASDSRCSCQYSVVLWAGLPSDSVLGSVPATSQ